MVFAGGHDRREMTSMSEQRLSASLEDYLKAILLSSREHGAVRPRDIVERLRVSGPSVTEALQNLRNRGLVNYLPYEAVSLTGEGQRYADQVLHRHRLLRRFLREVLLLDAAVADTGACLMEHVVSPPIIERMLDYAAFLEQCGDDEWSGGFSRYLEEHGRDDDDSATGCS